MPVRHVPRTTPWATGVKVAAVAGTLFVIGALGYQLVEASRSDGVAQAPGATTTVAAAGAAAAPVGSAVAGVSYTGHGATADTPGAGPVAPASPGAPAGTPGTTAAPAAPPPATTPAPAARPATTAPPPPPPTTAAPAPAPSPITLLLAIPVPNGGARQISATAVTYTYARGRSCGALVAGAYQGALQVGWVTESYVAGSPSAVMKHTDPTLRITIVCAPNDRNQVLEIGLV